MGFVSPLTVRADLTLPVSSTPPSTLSYQSMGADQSRPSADSSSAPATPAAGPDDFYTLLGIEESASELEIKVRPSLSFWPRSLVLNGSLTDDCSSCISWSESFSKASLDLASRSDRLWPSFLCSFQFTCYLLFPYYSYRLRLTGLVISSNLQTRTPTASPSRPLISPNFKKPTRSSLTPKSGPGTTVTVTTRPLVVVVQQTSQG